MMLVVEKQDRMEFDQRVPAFEGDVKDFRFSKRLALRVRVGNHALLTMAQN